MRDTLKNLKSLVQLGKTLDQFADNLVAKSKIKYLNLQSFVRNVRVLIGCEVYIEKPVPRV